MSFEKLVRIPVDRIGVIIGKSGKTKHQIEKKCNVNLNIDSETGEVIITSDKIDGNISPFKAVEIVSSMWSGFSPENSLRLLSVENSLHIIDLREFGGKSPDQIERIKGRIIGENGTARLNMENLTGATISVYGRTVGIIGEPNQLRLAVDAISSLCSGSMHGPVYNKLEAARRKEKAEKALLLSLIHIWRCRRRG